MKTRLTDCELISKVKSSDKRAFEALFIKYQPVLFRNVLFQIGDTDTAHDIVQETFIRVWEHRDSLNPQLSFLALLLKISKNLIKDMVKHKKVREKVHSLMASTKPDKIITPLEKLESTLLEERIIQIINENLPTRCKEIFILSRFEGLINKEISEILNISKKTVENQITHALKILRKKLKI